MGLAFFTVVFVLLIEQVRPLPYRWAVHGPLTWCASFLEGLLNAGERRHGIFAWLVAVGGLVLATGTVYGVLRTLNPLFGWLWSVLILYLTMGFRQFSHYYTDIQLALRMGDLPHARKLLADWRAISAEGWSSSEIARVSIEEALAASHRHVFAVLVCFIVLPGPIGAVLYRASAFFSEVWGRRNDADSRSFGAFSRLAFAGIDWLPARTTAVSFAIVGNFEDAIQCWRTQAARWTGNPLGGAIGVVLASAAGALGVRLGVPMVVAGEIADPAEIEAGDPADVDFMQSAVGLVWRALLLWLSLMLLLGVAGLVGP